MVGSGLALVVCAAQAAAVLWVVRIESAVYQFPAGQWPVVSVCAGCGTAWPLALAVSCQYLCAEGGAVGVAVAPLVGCASRCVRFAFVLGAA